jgi:hypothetical protein
MTMMMMMIMMMMLSETESIPVFRLGSPEADVAYIGRSKKLMSSDVMPSR